MIDITTILFTLHKNELVIIIYILFGLIFILSILIIHFCEKNKELKHFNNMFAGSVQRMSKYLIDHDWYDDYKKFNEKKYGESNENS